MNILIICDSFPPEFAARIGFLAHYLECRHNQVWVVTTSLWGNKPIYHSKLINAEVRRVDCDLGKLQILNPFIRFMRRLVCEHGEYQTLHDLMVKAAEELIHKNHIACVISSSAYSPLFASVAKIISQKNKLRWIADFRDIYEQLPPIKIQSIRGLYNAWWRLALIKRRNQVIRFADRITSVSNSNIAALSKINPNTILIPNGFDRDYFFPSLDNSAQIFQIIYGGKLYEDKRFQDPELFFQALAKIANQHKSFSIVANFFVEGDSRDIVLSYAEKYKITEMIKFHDLLETSEYASKIRDSQLGVIFANPLSKGVIPTKFYEYIGSGLPVILVPDDKGDISSILREKKLGLASASVDQIVDYILNAYQMWKNHSPLKIDSMIVKEYDRHIQSEKFLEIIKDLTKIQE